jgi:hypothetical protein
VKPGRRNRRVTALALLAASALLVGGIAGPGTTAFGDGGAAPAAKKKKKKKKCPPGTTKVKVKTKKGKKKKTKCVAQPGPTPAPRVRATITWSGGGMSSDMDLWVFDANGNRGRAAANGIPSSTFSGNASGPSGTESFTDQIFVTPGARSLSFGVCQVDGGSHNLTVNITYVTADGVTRTGSNTYNDNGAHAEYPGGAPIPPQFLTGCNFL